MNPEPIGPPLPANPLWYKDAVIYQTHVKSFADSNGDGIGDFRGLTDKLSYLEDLGVTALWLLPFYPSPLRDDGYDIADYTDIHPQYGAIQDFTRFLREAHRRGLRVITELVVNHTSDQHPWFQLARRSPPGSRERNFYVWSDTAEQYRSARIIFKDFEPSNWTYDSAAKAYFWHRFYAHQPDLNFDNPEVHRALFRVLDFWMRRGVDGLRLDAVPYLFEREGTSCENLPETHAFLKQLRKYVDERYQDRMLLAEANQWPEDAAAYFGDGDECHMNFHFPIMPRLFMAVRMEDRFPIVDIMRQTPAIPANCQWATFLRNHDELTLEMVTDRERDYMYQAYARDREMRINLGIRRRLAPLLNNDRRAIELMNALLFSLPGSPIIYYGDEIGMGDNVYLGDRNGVRTPMQWSGDRNAGFSRANPQRLYLPAIIDPQFHYEMVNVEAQENNPQSLLWWMRRMIGLRKRLAALGRGSLEFLLPSNSKVLAFLREHQDQRVLVVANLSRFAQQVELDLARFKGMSPVEAVGQTRFRPVGEGPYWLALGPYGFYWFVLEPAPVETVEVQPVAAPVEITVHGGWENVFEGRSKAALERLLAAYWNRFPWFPQDRRVESARLVDAIRLVRRRRTIYLAIVQVEHGEGLVETYQLPLAYAAGEAARAIEEKMPQARVAAIVVPGVERGLLYGAMWDPEHHAMLLHAIAGRRRHSGRAMDIAGSSGRRLAEALQAVGDPSAGTAESPEQTARPKGRRELIALLSDAPHIEVLNPNRRRVLAIFGKRLLLKSFRRLETTVHPEIEIGRFLTERGFAYAPALLGSLDLRRAGLESSTLAILYQYVRNEGTAWQHALHGLEQFFEQAVARGSAATAQAAVSSGDLLDGSRRDALAPIAGELLGFYLAQMRLLGERTAEMHHALASDSESPAFAPEPFTPFYQRSQMQAFRNLRVQTLQKLRGRIEKLPEPVRPLAQAVLDADGDLRDRFRPIGGRLESLRIRGHGNYHLGQILYTGKDFSITDFEGDPRESLSERRGKHSALRDVASMIRSFHYAAHHALRTAAAGSLPAGADALEPWRRLWLAYVPGQFLRGYLDAARSGAFLPPTEEELRALLQVALLEELLVEISAELDNRPDHAALPLQGILDVLHS